MSAAKKKGAAGLLPAPVQQIEGTRKDGTGVGDKPAVFSYAEDLRPPGAGKYGIAWYRRSQTAPAEGSRMLEVYAEPWSPGEATRIAVRMVSEMEKGSRAVVLDAAGAVIASYW